LRAFAEDLLASRGLLRGLGSGVATVWPSWNMVSPFGKETVFVSGKDGEMNDPAAVRRQGLGCTEKEGLPGLRAGQSWPRI